MSANSIVHVVDDDIAVRQSLAFLLATAGLAVRVHEFAAALLDTIDGAAPCCVVTDIRMPGMDGIELLRELRRRDPKIPVIMMTGHADVPMAVEAMRLGAADFIEKPFDDEMLLRSIGAALALSDARMRRQHELGDIRARRASLSEREEQVLCGLVAGCQNKVIAADLAISPRTVEIYRANLMTKMQATSLSDLVRMTLLADGIEAADPRS